MLEKTGSLSGSVSLITHLLFYMRRLSRKCLYLDLFQKLPSGPNSAWIKLPMFYPGLVSWGTNVCKRFLQMHRSLQFLI